MPPKKVFQPDWEWIHDITSPDQITHEHRRRAAGIEKLNPCPSNINLDKPPIRLDEDDDIIEIDSKVKSKAKIKSNKIQGCTKKGCLRNPRCYNHLGAEQVIDPEAKENYLNEHGGIIPLNREGSAGLRNLGATCYANAFLQLWFHNVAFRNGVYDCVTTESTPLYHLAMVFGMLQHSNRQVVDPMGLIEALRLEKGNQQDAAEFSKLFMSVLASEFAKHPNEQLRSFLKDQFEGEMEYSTNCQCGYVSRNTSTFLELELSIKDKSTLEECIESLSAPEILEGDNLYNCPRCLRHREATRRQIPTKLPPVLHMALMRFVFDYNTLTRKKSPASITYPKQLTLGGVGYSLRAVITHEGKSAHHGHFICEVYDEADQSWLLCNDEEVKNLSERPAKKARLSLKLDSDQRTSKDAYMLVYKRNDGTQAIPKEPPPAIWDRVIAQNVTLEEERNAVGVKRLQLDDEFDHLNGLKKYVLRLLPGIDYLIPRDSLIRWLEAETFAQLYEPFDMSLIMCEHGGVDAYKVDEARLISEEAFEQIQMLNECPPIDICSICVESGYIREKIGTELDSHVMEVKRANEEGEKEYIISRSWYEQWINGSLPVGKLPDSEGYSLYCEHGGRAVVTKNLLKKTYFHITEKALNALKSIVGEFQAFHQDKEECEECSEMTDINGEIRKARLEESKLDKQIKKRLNPDGIILGHKYYAVPDEFIVEWEKYIKGDIDQPKLDMGFCKHGLLNFDPQMESTKFLKENDWDLLLTKYGEQKPIILKFGNVQPGKKTSVEEFSPAICIECATERRSDFDSIVITVVRKSSPSPPLKQSTLNVGSSRRSSVLQNGFNRDLPDRTSKTASTRSNKFNSYTLQGNRETSIKDIKVSIMNKTLGKLTPIQQKLTYQGREVSSDETIGSLGFLLGDEFGLEEQVEADEIDDGDDEMDLLSGGGMGGNEKGKERRGRNEGFGGTALLARLACPDCTFENDGAALSCEMCGRPFRIDDMP